MAPYVKGAEVWALGLFRVYKGYIRGRKATQTYTFEGLGLNSSQLPTSNNLLPVVSGFRV